MEFTMEFWKQQLTTEACLSAAEDAGFDVDQAVHCMGGDLNCPRCPYVGVDYGIGYGGYYESVQDESG